MSLLSKCGCVFCVGVFMFVYRSLGGHVTRRSLRGREAVGDGGWGSAVSRVVQCRVRECGGGECWCVWPALLAFCGEDPDNPHMRVGGLLLLTPLQHSPARAHVPLNGFLRVLERLLCS